MNEKYNDKRERMLRDLEIFVSNGYVSARSILIMLAEHDVVIRVDKKLPIALQMPGVFMWLEQSGFEAVEPLLDTRKEGE